MIKITEEILLYSGIATFGMFKHSRDLTDVDIAVMGVPFDNGTTNRSGQRQGPRAIRAVSNLALDFNYQWDTDDFTLRTACQNIIDYGDVGASVGEGAASHMISETYKHAKKIIEAGGNVVCIGGDHTVPFGPIRAIAEKYGKVSILHFDSHQDSIPSDGQISHANFAYDLVEEGYIDAKQSAQIFIRTNMDNCGYNILYADEAIELGPKELAKKLKAIVGDNPVYITFDIDAFDPSVAPGTGTPVCGGPNSNFVKTMFRNLDGINVVGGDVVEVNPLYDTGEITSLLAASIAQDIMCLIAKTRLRNKK